MTDRVEMISEMLRHHPDDPFLNYALALEYKKADKPDEAISLLQNLIKKQPEYLASYYQLGKLLEETGDEMAAIAVYRAGTKIASKVQDPKTMGELNEALLLLDAEENF